VNVVLREPAVVQLEFWQEDGVRYRRQFEADALEQSLPLIGLRGGQESHLLVRSEVEGCSVRSEQIDFETAALSSDVDIHMQEYAGTPSDGSMVIFEVDDLQEETPNLFVGVDRAGEVVWTYENKDFLMGSGVAIESIGEDQFFHRTINGSVTVDAFGLLEREIMTDINPSHDAALLPDGNVVYITLFRERRTTEAWGEIWIQANKIVEFNEAGEEVWSWNSLDYLDLERFPGYLSEPVNGVSDWTHMNSVQYLEDTDQLLVGVRHQHQVILIDHSTGELLWTLGRDGDFELLEGEWFKAQHDASVLKDGSILLYDNGNGKTGELSSRVVRYALDKEARSAREVWSYELPVYMISMGSVEQLESGSMLISAGGHRRGEVPAEIFEVSQGGEEVWGLELPGEGENRLIYRVDHLQFAERLDP